MPVDCLLVSRDPKVQQTVAEVFAGVDLHLREDTISALALVGKNHFDGFIIDCDGMEHGTDIIAGVRGSRSNRNSVIFAIIHGRTSVATATDLGANFVVAMPLDRDRLSTYFQSSLHKMEQEHRRYFRYQLVLDAEVIHRDGEVVSAQILNVSDGGLALRLLDETHIQGSATLRFTIPSTPRASITVVAGIWWSRGPICGMRFFHMDPGVRETYLEWLASMALT